MLKLSKKTEYAILAMQYFASSSDKLVSAKEISEKLNISFDFLSKTLQALMRNGLIISHQGTRGGYTLARAPEETTLGDIIDALDESSSVVNCTVHNNEPNCNRIDDCTIRQPMTNIQKKIHDVFYSTTIAEMAVDYKNVPQKIIDLS